MDLTIPLVLQNKTPIYLQIYEYMKREISHGSLRAVHVFLLTEI